MNYSKLMVFLKQYHPEHIEEYKQILLFGNGDIFLYDNMDTNEYEKPVITNLPNEFITLTPGTTKDVLVIPFLKYLHQRGLLASTIYKYNIGCCLSGRYYGRVVIPSYDLRGNVNYFIGRAIHDNHEPTYLNAYSDKNKIIFNEKNLHANTNTIIITEGVFDMMAIDQVFGDRFGYTAMLGKFISDRLLDVVADQQPKIYLCIDNDAWIQSKKIAEKLQLYGAEVYIAHPPKNVKDFGQLTKEGIIIKNCIQHAQPYNDMKFLMEYKAQQ